MTFEELMHAVPAWMEGSLAGFLLLAVVVPFLLSATRGFTRKQAAEGTLSQEILKQLRERDAALGEERHSNLAEQRTLRESHAAEMRAERENAAHLQSRVLDLSAQMVKQAQENASQVVAAVEKVRDENRAGLKELASKLAAAEQMHHECEKRHIERDAEAEQRRRAEELRNAERDNKIADLVRLVQSMNGP